MKEKTLKLKKGGLDTIVAYIVVMLPLLYVLIYMVATIYHFSVQTYVSQVAKEAIVMASTYGQITPNHEQYIKDKLSSVVGNVKIGYRHKVFNDDSGLVTGGNTLQTTIPTVSKGDIVGIYVESSEDSILGKVTAFNIFGANDTSSGLKYSAYREEIIRNEK